MTERYYSNRDLGDEDDSQEKAQAVRRSRIERRKRLRIEDRGTEYPLNGGYDLSYPIQRKIDLLG